MRSHPSRRERLRRGLRIVPVPGHHGPAPHLDPLGVIEPDLDPRQRVPLVHDAAARLGEPVRAHGRRTERGDGGSQIDVQRSTAHEEREFTERAPELDEPMDHRRDDARPDRPLVGEPGGIEGLVDRERVPAFHPTQQDEQTTGVRGRETGDPAVLTRGAQLDVGSTDGVAEAVAGQLGEPRGAARPARRHHGADLVSDGSAVREQDVVLLGEQQRRLRSIDDALVLARGEPLVEDQEGDAAFPEVGDRGRQRAARRQVDGHQLAGGSRARHVG